MNQVNRRRFLQAAITSSVALSPPPRLGAWQKPKIKAGFLGAAHSHALAKWKLLSASPDFEVVGLADDSPEVRSRYEKLGANIISVEQLLRTADAVIVESAVRDHARHANTALSAGKHVHVEKPPAVTMKEMIGLADLARKGKRALQVGYMWRYHPGFTVLFEAARKGWLGDISMVRGTINTSLAPDQRGHWAQFKGGVMFELGCHLIDPMVRLLGPPLAIKPTLRHHASVEDDLNDNNAVVFEFKRALGVITNSTHQPNAFAHRSFEVCAQTAPPP